MQKEPKGTTSDELSGCDPIPRAGDKDLGEYVDDAHLGRVISRTCADHTVKGVFVFSSGGNCYLRTLHK